MHKTEHPSLEHFNNSIFIVVFTLFRVEKEWVYRMQLSRMTETWTSKGKRATVVFFPFVTQLYGELPIPVWLYACLEKAHSRKIPQPLGLQSEENIIYSRVRKGIPLTKHLKQLNSCPFHLKKASKQVNFTKFVKVVPFRIFLKNSKKQTFLAELERIDEYWPVCYLMNWELMNICRCAIWWIDELMNINQCAIWWIDELMNIG